jgi:ABC-type lipoprotein release transport system permease subunit
MRVDCVPRRPRGTRVRTHRYRVDTVLSLASGHVIAALLYETAPYDPRVLVGVALLLSGGAAAASLAPGWRASRIDLATALRVEG